MRIPEPPEHIGERLQRYAMDLATAQAEIEERQKAVKKADEELRSAVARAAAAEANIQKETQRVCAAAREQFAGDGS